MSVLFRSRSQCLAVVILGCLGLCNEATAQVAAAPVVPSTVPQGEFVNRVLTDDAGDHKYVVFVPANYLPSKKWPTILYLHGASNRGTDGRSQLVSGMAPAIRLQLADYPFLVVFPQCEDTNSRVLGGWTDQPEDAERAVKILDAVENEFSVDKNREMLIGLSMGGAGAWDIAAKSPNRWAALVPVSAMASVEDAPKVAGIPTWVFHAANDPLVPTQIARNMVAAINTAGGHAYLSEVSKRGHDLSNVVFTQSALREWLLEPGKEPNQNLDWEEPKGYNSGHELEVPFVPGAEMTRALRFRVCKDVLEAICYAAPEKLATNPMGGYVGGVHQTTKVGGFLPIDVDMTGMYYRGAIEQVRIIPKAPNRLFVQAGLRNLTMTVSNSQLSGKLLLSATAGQINVVIGHRAPVWLTAELHPYVKDHHLYLNVVGMDFQIPPDNWFVTQPSDVHVRGLPFLNGQVSGGLVNGIYAKKGEFERQVMNSIPGLIQNLETKLNDQMLSKTVSIGQIAMPIWQPRMRTFPEDVVVDDDGFTVVSSIQLCTLGHVAKDFKMRQYAPMKEFPQPVKTGIEINVAETMVSAWSELIVAGKVNRFNVCDFTQKEYHVLADRDYLQEVIPDLKRFGDEMEANVDFQLRDPIHLLEPSDSGEPRRLEATIGNNALKLSLSSVPLYVGIRKKGERKWMPVGELDLSIDRDYAPYVSKPDFIRRGPRFAERSAFRITTKWTFSPEYKAENEFVDEAKFLATVLKAREAGQLLAGVKPESAQDLPLAGVPMRMDAMDWVKQHLVVQWQLPGLLVSNDTKEPLTYEVRGPQSGWSQPKTLAPGEYDEFRVTYPLTWRRRLPTETQFYTLPLGREFSYRDDPKPGMVLVKQHDNLHEETMMR